MDTITLAKELEKIVGIDAEVDSQEICFEVDNGPRTDHGGGPNGDEWMDPHKVEQLKEEYKDKHQDKIYKIKSFIEDNGIGASVYWEYSYKGRCLIKVFR